MDEIEQCIATITAELDSLDSDVTPDQLKSVTDRLSELSERFFDAADRVEVEQDGMTGAD